MLVLFYRTIGVFFLLTTMQCAPSSTDTDTAPQANRCAKWCPGHYGLISINSPAALFDSNVAIIDDVAAITYNLTALDSLLRTFSPGLRGIEVGFFWRMLEPGYEQYRFSQIDAILALCRKYDKMLLLHISERIFSPTFRAVPDYLYTDTLYQGGVASMKDGQGSIAKVWLPAVFQRYCQLLEALAHRYDSNPAFGGITLSESALVLDSVGDYSSSGYESFLTGRVEWAVKKFPQSVVFQGINWGVYGIVVEDIVQHAFENGAGIHGPDLIADAARPAEKRRIEAYSFYPQYKGKMPLGCDVQAGQLNGVNNAAGLESIYAMGKDSLKLDYIFWLIQADAQGVNLTTTIQPFLESHSTPLASDVCPENRVVAY